MSKLESLDRNSKRIQIALLLLLSVFVLILCAARFVGSVSDTSLSSDILYSLSLYRDLFERPFSIRNWHLTPAPYFVPDLAGTFALFPLFSNDGHALSAYVILMGLGVTFFTLAIERTYRASRGSLPLTVTGVALFWAAAWNFKSGWVAQLLLIPSYHGGIVLLMLAMVWLMARALSDTPRWPYFWLFTLLYLAVTSDFLALPQFAFPALVALGWAGRGYLPRRSFYQICVLFLLASAAGFVTHTAINRSGLFSIGRGIPHILAGRNWESVQTFWRDIPTLFTEFTSYLVFGILWTAAAAIALVKHNRKRPTSSTVTEVRRRFVLTYALLATVLAVTATVLNGGYSDIGIARRFIPTFVFPFLFLGALAGPGSFFDRPWKTLPLTAILLAFLVHWPSWRSFRASDLDLPYPHEVRCLDEAALSLGAKYGVGNYWSSKFVSELSRKGVWVNQITPRLEPYLWINNPSWFKTPTGVRPDYRFVILSEMDMAVLDGELGSAAETRQCGTLRIAFYKHALALPRLP